MYAPGSGAENESVKVCESLRGMSELNECQCRMTVIYVLKCDRRSSIRDHILVRLRANW